MNLFYSNIHSIVDIEEAHLIGLQNSCYFVTHVECHSYVDDK